MAKGSKSKTTGGRDTSTSTPDPIAKLTQPLSLPRPITPVADAVLSNDRRRHDPTKSTRPPHDWANKSAARIVATPVRALGKAATSYRRTMLLVNSPLTYARRKVGYSTVSERLSFNIPKRLEMCIRRAVRSQVLHAKRKTGKVGQRKPHRNFWSKISCKR